MTAIPLPLQELHRTIQTLPESVAAGLPSDTLSVFFTPAKDLLLDGQDAWEDVVNPTLDRVFGFGTSEEAVRALVRRGPYGMDGVYRYLASCISDLNINAGLFEGKVERLLKAMVEL